MTDSGPASGNASALPVAPVAQPPVSANARLREIPYPNYPGKYFPDTRSHAAVRCLKSQDAAANDTTRMPAQ